MMSFDNFFSWNVAECGGSIADTIESWWNIYLQSHHHRHRDLFPFALSSQSIQ
jgi:hypothetical protein